MSGFRAMFRKELRQQMRTFRAPVVLGVFVVIGLGSPLIAKVTPELISSLATDELGGMELLLLKEPGTSDALFQYQKNFALLPLMVVLLSMGLVGGEKRRGTAPVVLSKPVTRRGFLLAKVAAGALLYLLGTVLSASGCLVYTTVLFGEVHLPGFLVLNGLLVLTLWCYLGITLLGSVVFSSTAAAAGMGLAAFAVFSALAFLPSVAKFTPGGLGRAVTDLVLGREPGGMVTAVLASALLLAAAVAAAERVFSSQEI